MPSGRDDGAVARPRVPRIPAPRRSGVHQELRDGSAIWYQPFPAGSLALISSHSVRAWDRVPGNALGLHTLQPRVWR